MRGVGNIIMGTLSTLTELYSEGKSGSFFYYSFDGKYMVKTISHTEHRFFRHILEKYYSHMVQNRDTMLVRFLGAHKIRQGKHSKVGSKSIYFVVMGNLFDTPLKIHRRYDLKGSWVGRLCVIGAGVRRSTKDADRGDTARGRHAKRSRLYGKAFFTEAKRFERIFRRSIKKRLCFRSVFRNGLPLAPRHQARGDGRLRQRRVQPRHPQH